MTSKCFRGWHSKFAGTEVGQLNVLILVFLLVTQAHCANILFFLLVTGHSHQVAIHPLAKALSDRGHRITFYSTYPVQNQHVDIDYLESRRVAEYWTGALTEIARKESAKARFDPDENVYNVIFEAAVGACEVFYEDEKMAGWAKDATNFDLVIYDASYNDCGYPIAYRSNASQIIFYTGDLLTWDIDEWGIVSESAWIPDIRLQLSSDMNFSERVYNTLYTLWKGVTLVSGNYFPRIDAILEQNFPGVPSVQELKKATDLLFINSYFALDYAKSLPPFAIQVGGLHCEEGIENKLPEEFEKFVESPAFEGFVYVSFGSLGALSEEKKWIMFSVMEKSFPQIGFVMKWTGELPKKYPDNVLPVTWAPQTKLLAHPKIMAFITQCGRLSTTEAVFYGVPMIGFPIFADQWFIGESLKYHGVLVLLKLEETSSEILESALLSVFHDPSYAKNTKITRKLFLDRQNSPLETAVWWSEFLIRHKKDAHTIRKIMKPKSKDMHLIQSRLIDVWFCVFAVVAIVVWTVLKIIFKVLGMFCGGRKKIDGFSRNKKWN